MNLKDLKEKYNKAHKAYVSYKDTNGTNSVESQSIPDAIKAIQSIFPNSTITLIGDNILNYLGVDFIVSNDDGSQMLLELKVCKSNSGFEVTIDAYKHNGNEWFPASEVKLNDWFLFVNEDNYILIPSDTVNKMIPPIEECFFYKRDIYKTTKKAIVDLSCKRKITIPR